MRLGHGVGRWGGWEAVCTLRNRSNHLYYIVFPELLWNSEAGAIQLVIVQLDCELLHLPFYEPC